MNLDAPCRDETSLDHEEDDPQGKDRSVYVYKPVWKRRPEQSGEKVRASKTCVHHEQQYDRHARKKHIVSTKFRDLSFAKTGMCANELIRHLDGRRLVSLC